MNAHARVHAVTAALEGRLLTAADAAASGDPGGETKYGVSQRLLDSLGVTRESIVAPRRVDEVTPQVAERIGRALFWETTHCGELWMASPSLALVVYDCAFQSGPDRAVKLLQVALGVTADGSVGPVTLAAAQSCAEPLLVALDAIAERRAFLMRWAPGEERRAALVRGLHHRCDEISRAAVAIESECRGWDMRAPLAYA